MKPLKCGICTTCCQWGGVSSVRPLLSLEETSKYNHEVSLGGFVLAAKKSGDCVYLGLGGCKIYSTRPEQCRNFDCRVLYKELREKTFIKVILVGKRKLK